jgi:hypothetical protein
MKQPQPNNRIRLALWFILYRVPFGLDDLNHLNSLLNPPKAKAA